MYAPGTELFARAAPSLCCRRSTKESVAPAPTAVADSGAFAAVGVGKIIGTLGGREAADAEDGRRSSVSGGWAEKAAGGAAEEEKDDKKEAPAAVVVVADVAVADPDNDATAATDADDEKR